jgi:hypothetical protein
MRRRVDRAAAALAHTLAATLDPGERAVVLGDLAESRARPSKVLSEIAGLAVRRQLSALAAPGPWVALVVIALPVGALLSHVTRWWADGDAVYLHAYVAGFSWTYVENPGSRRDLVELASRLITQAAALALWAWTTGVALRLLSRRAVWVVSFVFALTIFAATLGTTTSAFEPWQRPRGESHFYGVVLPRLVRAGLVLVPLAAGARAARRWPPLPVRPLLAVAVASVALTVVTAVGVESSVSYGRSTMWTTWAAPGPDGVHGSEDDPRPLSLRLVPAPLVVPPVFIGVMAVVSSRSRRLSPCSGQAQER